MRSAGQQLLGHPSSVARPLRPVNLGPRDGAVEEHHKSSRRRFGVLQSRRLRPLKETLREPFTLTVSNDAGLREDDVLVQIRAAGVNLLDSKIRNGEFKRILPYRLPLILGHDVVGVVVRVECRVRRFKPGDEVYARPADGRIGAFAEFIAIKEDDVAIKPTALSMEEAASIPLVA